MAIYKLKDIYTKKPEYGIGAKALDSGKYKYVRQADIDFKKFGFYVNSGPFLENGDVLISRAGAFAGKTYIHTSGPNHIFAGYLVRYKLDPKKVINKYFYLWTKTNSYKRQMLKLRTGAAQPNFNPNMVGELEIYTPSINEQRKIIDIIEPHEELFLKYSNCVRIDNFINAKNDVKQIIDIIEPIEEGILKVGNTLKKILDFISNIRTKEKFFKMFECAKISKEKAHGINQVSAKVMNKRSAEINSFESVGTYKTNTFYCSVNTLLINTIRTYLEKFAILPLGADCNGTLAQIIVEEKHTSIIHNLMNDDFWKQAKKLSKGTKMPVLNKKDLMFNIKMKETVIEIPNIFEMLSSLNVILIKLESLKKKMIEMLIK